MTGLGGVHFQVAAGHIGAYGAEVTPDDLASKLLEVVARFHPMDESLFGLAECDGRLPDLSEEAQDEEVAILREVARQAGELDVSGMDEAALQTSDLVRYGAPARADAAAVPSIEFTVGDFQGAPVAWVLAMMPKAPLGTHEQANAYLARLEGLPAFLETAAARHLRGVDAGRTPVRRLVQAAIAQLDAFLADPALGGLRRTRAQDASFAEHVDRAIDGAVRPALARYRETLSSRLVRAGRDDKHCGLCRLPDGDAMYAALARVHTSIDRAPQELHRTGLEIAERIKDEIRDLAWRVWHISDFSRIVERLRTDPELRYHDGQEILSDVRAALARAEDAAPRWFGVLPESSCRIESVPAVEEGSAPPYYMPPALDGSQPGTCYVNTSRPAERSRADSESTAFHETVPGHHLQLTIAHSLPDLSLARRVLHDTACAEGWALYAERLADEMELYSSDLARLGMLTADMWRAGRLVVDTGIHHLGWGREQAMDWFIANVPLPRLVIEAEVNRYITYPGQALAFMVGRLELERLRREASARLRGRFSVRAFHDVVLRAGPLPLAAMAGVVGRWIESTEGSAG